jgi:arylsulfatase A-like enzyme
MLNEAEVGRALRTDRYTYAVYAPEADPVSDPAADTYIERCLYDLHADPYERTNLVGRSDHSDVANDLRSRLRDRIETVEGARPSIEQAEYQA